MNKIKIGQCIDICGNRFMRIDKRSAKRCYNFNYAFEVRNNEFRRYSGVKTFTVGKSEYCNLEFDKAIEYWKDTKSDSLEFFIPVKVIDRFTGNDPNKNTPVENHIFVYNTDAYEVWTSFPNIKKLVREND